MCGGSKNGGPGHAWAPWDAGARTDHVRARRPWRLRCSVHMPHAERFATWSLSIPAPQGRLAGLLQLLSFESGVCWTYSIYQGRLLGAKQGPELAFLAIATDVSFFAFSRFSVFSHSQKWKVIVRPVIIPPEI